MLVVIVGFDALRPDKIWERQESTLIQFRRALKRELFRAIVSESEQRLIHS